MLFGANQFALLHFRYTRTFFDLRIVVISGASVQYGLEITTLHRIKPRVD
jgi:hypothetical protein